MKDSVIIVSGGLDSITLLYDKAETIALAVSFDYGQNHGTKELPFAAHHCRKLGIPHITIPLSFMHRYFKSSLLDGAEAIPEGHYAEENMKSTVVPFRNGIMLAIATSPTTAETIPSIRTAVRISSRQWMVRRQRGLSSTCTLKHPIRISPRRISCDVEQLWALIIPRPGAVIRVLMSIAGNAGRA